MAFAEGYELEVGHSDRGLGRCERQEVFALTAMSDGLKCEIDERDLSCVWWAMNRLDQQLSESSPQRPALPVHVMTIGRCDSEANAIKPVTWSKAG